MSTPYVHEPVLAEAIIQLIVEARPRVVVDATVGGAGHAVRVLEALPEARLIGVDRDPAAVHEARARLAPFAERAVVLHGRFAELPALLRGVGLERVDALYADLGVSSPQLDRAERGFSFMRPGPLDMRMDPSRGPNAAELLAELDSETLAAALRDFGEERHARRVARAMIAEKPTTTQALAELVRRCVPRSHDGIDPATRTFQALRILVNHELAELAGLLAVAPDLLADGGVVAIISFHSLEDRAVKHAFRRLAKGCVCPPGLPVCVCGQRPSLAVLTPQPVEAEAAEVARNPRARSAKLRAARRLPRQS